MGSTPHLIGIAFVDVSHLTVMDNSSNLVTGYFHIVDPGQIKNSQEINYISTGAVHKQSLGQLKVSISVDKSFKSFVQRAKRADHDFKADEVNYNYQQSIQSINNMQSSLTFGGNELQTKMCAPEPETAMSMEFNETLHLIDEGLKNVDDDELEMRHS